MVIDVHICCDVSPEYEISSQVVIDLSYLNCSYTYSFNWQIEFFFAEILQFFWGDNAILLLKAEVFIWSSFSKQVLTLDWINVLSITIPK